MPASSSSTTTKRSARPSRSTSATGARSRKNAASTRATISGPDSITNYTTALRWLNQHIDYERIRLVRYNQDTFNLARMRKLLDLLGNPQDQLKIVHLAGTKGKGSATAMLSHMLQACGYKVGAYTSPHLIDLRERITIDNQMIGYPEAADLLKLIAEQETSLDEQDQPTFFEVLTAAAFMHFANHNVDLAIIETGLGGRLDSTNVVQPLVTGITSISLDHMNILGNDLATIAREKAGIFKKDVPAVSVEQPADAAAALQEVAERTNAPLSFTGNGQAIDFSYRFEASRELGPHTRVCLTTQHSRFEHLPVPLKGEHQAHNCGLALALLDQLKAMDFHLPDDRVVRGLAEATLPGRLEQVHAEPRVIIDGAHNAASVHALIRALGAHVSYDSLVVIFGTGQDKDVTGMLKQLALGADKVIFTRAKSNPRAVEPDELSSKFAELSGKMSQTAATLPEALKLAGRAVSREDLIVVTGSFYLAGEARKYFIDGQQKRQKQR